MKTAGVDCATCTGLALVGDWEDRGKTIHVPHERGYLRLQLIAEDVVRTFQVWEPQLVAIESYAYVRNIQAFITLVEVGTLVRNVLFTLRIPWLEVPPAVLKKWTTGKGNADKPAMAAAVKARWNYQSHSHDIVDAFALAQMAQLGWKSMLDITGVSIGWPPQGVKE